MPKKKKIKIALLFKDNKVEFLDIRSGFWRFGACYKENKTHCWVRDCLGKRYKVLKNNVLLSTATTKSNEIK